MFHRNVRKCTPHFVSELLDYSNQLSVLSFVQFIFYSKYIHSPFLYHGIVEQILP